MFNRHLMGQVEGVRSIPIRTISPDSPGEMITFKLVDAQEIERPFGWWIQLMRVPTLMRVLMPLIYVSLVHWTLVLDWTAAAVASLGILSFFIAAFLFNDFQDHMRGLDRISMYRGTRAIQNGWVSAIAVRNAAVVFFVLSLILAAVTITLKGTDLIAVGLLVSSLTSLYFVDRLGLRNRASREMIDFLLFGPTLVGAFEFVLIGEVQATTLSFGLVWGALIAQHHFVHRFSRSLFFEKVGFHMLTRRLGFERSRQMIVGLSFSVIGFLALFCHWAHPRQAITLAVFVAFLPFLFRELRSIQSPVSSGFARLARVSRLLVWTVGLAAISVEAYVLWGL